MTEQDGIRSGGALFEYIFVVVFFQNYGKLPQKSFDNFYTQPIIIQQLIS